MMPTFLLLGAAKSGTTSLYHYLNAHPDVYMSPIKEPKYFALAGTELCYSKAGENEMMRKSSVLDEDSYRRLFEPASRFKAAGEASTLYLYSDRAPGRIKNRIPDIKLAAILRQPAERAYSNFLYMARKGEEPLRDFDEALSEEANRRDWMPRWHYLQRGFYYQQLKRYFDLFPRSQIRVYLYEDLAASPAALLADFYRFIGVDDAHVPEGLRAHNVSGLPRSELLHSLQSGSNPVRTVARAVLPTPLRQRLSRALRDRNLKRPRMPEETRQRLNNAYRGDIIRLQDLIQRDLTAWLS